MFAGCTSPLMRRWRFLLLDFFVSRWPRVGFRKEMLPLAVTLKVFLALEWVLTFGMTEYFLFTLLVPPHWQGTYGTVWANIPAGNRKGAQS
jgi:hypothetical protein